MTRLVWVAPVVLVMTVAGCTGEDRAAAPAGPATSAVTTTPAAAPQTSEAAKPVVTAPAAVDGELARRVYTAGVEQQKGTTVLSRLPREGQEYEARAACASTAAGRSLTMAVRSAEPGSSDQPLIETAVPCDGTETAVGWTAKAPVGPVAVTLEGVQPDVESAYAVLVPATR